MKLSNKAYEILKRLAMVWIPGVATLYGTLSVIWGLPYSSQVIGSLTAADAFLGVLLGISTSMYKAAGPENVIGSLVVNSNRTDGGPKYSFTFDRDLEVLENLTHIVLKVKRVLKESPAEINNPASSLWLDWFFPGPATSKWSKRAVPLENGFASASFSTETGSGTTNTPGYTPVTGSASKRVPGVRPWFRGIQMTADYGRQGSSFRPTFNEG